MRSKLNRIHQGDCIEGMAELPEGSVDLAFADPPFNIGYEYDEYDDRLESEQYLDWSRRWMAEVIRVLKPDGTFWLAIGDEYAAELKVMLTREHGLTCRSWVVWYYTFGVNCKNKFSRSHAHLFHFVKDPREFTFNAEAIRVPSARQLVYGDRRANPKGRLPDDTWILRPQDLPDGFQPDEDTWYFPRVAGTFKERAGWHGCQMPERLLGRIIQACSNPGETVLDPFAGSGTTLAVAKKLDRQFIGYELSQEYTERARSRTEQARSGDPLDGVEDPLSSAPSTRDGTRLEERNQKSRGTLARSKQRAPRSCPADEIKISDTDERHAIVHAFAEIHDGFSSDCIIADPEMNAAFIVRCQEFGVSKSAGEINRLLLRLRKAGKLRSMATRNVHVPRDQIDQYLFASEIAARRLCDQGHSLDAVLCDPELALRFDRIAGQFAPGFSSFEYRWGAFKIRKANKEKDRKIAGLDPKLKRRRGQTARPLAELDFRSIPPKPAVYRVVAGNGTDLYIGEAENLRARIYCQFRDNTLPSWKEQGRSLFLNYISAIPEAPQREGLQMYMVSRYHPKLNFFLYGDDTAAA